MKLRRKLQVLALSMATGGLFFTLSMFPIQETKARHCVGHPKGDNPADQKCARSGTGCPRECGFLEFE